MLSRLLDSFLHPGKARKLDRPEEDHLDRDDIQKLHQLLDTDFGMALVAPSIIARHSEGKPFEHREPSWETRLCVSREIADLYNMIHA